MTQFDVNDIRQKLPVDDDADICHGPRFTLHRPCNRQNWNKLRIAPGHQVGLPIRRGRPIIRIRRAPEPHVICSTFQKGCRVVHRFFICLCAVPAWLLSEGFAEEFSVRPLTADEQEVLSSIQEKQLLDTLSYLASDEMNGRDTPSRELDIAADFVANRFRQAGLEGLGASGSFFQTAELFRTSAPQSTAVLTVGSSLNVPLTVLTGTNGLIKISGVVRDAAANNMPAADDGQTTIFVMDEHPLPPQATDDPAVVLTTYVRRVAPLVRQGAKIVLVRVTNGSVLFDVAAAFQQTPVLIPAELEPQCAIVLVSETQSLEGKVALEIPANVRTSTPVHNVVGVLRGSDPEAAGQAVVISAHLDHIGPARRGDDKVNNGADDNASGVTGVLLLADAFAALKVRPRRSLIFMTFWGEEKGLLGSKYFAENPLWNLTDIVCDINLEMIGRPEEHAEGRAWGTGWSRSSLGPQVAAGAIRAGVLISDHERFSEMLYTRSDNASFVAKGIIAHSFSAGSLHRDYHQPTDEVAKINIPHMTRIIQGLLAGILPIAMGELTPRATR